MNVYKLVGLQTAKRYKSKIMCLFACCRYGMYTTCAFIFVVCWNMFARMMGILPLVLVLEAMCLFAVITVTPLYFMFWWDVGDQEAVAVYNVARRTVCTVNGPHRLFLIPFLKYTLPVPVSCMWG